MTPEAEDKLIKSIGFIEGTLKQMCLQCKDHAESIKTLEEGHQKNTSAVARLEVKSGVWGVGGGMLAAAALYLKQHLIP